MPPIINNFAFGSTGLPDFDFTSANAFASPSSSSSLPYPSYPPVAANDLVDLSAILPGFSATSSANNFSFLDTSLPSPLGGNGEFNFTYSADVPPVHNNSLSPLSSTSNADPAEESSSSSSAHSARSPSTPPSFISDYRDPALPAFKSVASDFNFGGDRADLDDFSAFLVTSPGPVPESLPTPIYPAGSQKQGGYKFDLDGLCSEFVLSSFLLVCAELIRVFAVWPRKLRVKKRRDSCCKRR